MIYNIRNGQEPQEEEEKNGESFHSRKIRNGPLSVNIQKRNKFMKITYFQKKCKHT